MTWTVNVVNRENGLADVTATYSDESTSFSWSSTIKVSEKDEFVKVAKRELAKHNNLHKDEDKLKTSIEAELNK